MIVLGNDGTLYSQYTRNGKTFYRKLRSNVKTPAQIAYYARMKVAAQRARGKPLQLVKRKNGEEVMMPAAAAEIQKEFANYKPVPLQRDLEREARQKAIEEKLVPVVLTPVMAKEIRENPAAPPHRVNELVELFA